MDMPFLLSRFKRILQRYREGGIMHVLKHSLYYSCVHNWIIWLADFQILGLTRTPETTASLPPNQYTLEFADEGHLSSILTCMPEPDRKHLEELFRNFFHDGNRCVIALLGKRVVGYLWAFTEKYVITPDDYRRSNLIVQFPSSAVFIGNAYVMPEHRGHGLYQRMSHYLMQQYPPGECFYAAVSDLNTPSLIVNYKLGFKELATVRFLKLFAYTLLYVREAGKTRWRSYYTRWPDLKLDGARMQALPLELPGSTPDERHSIAVPRLAREITHIRKERRNPSIGRLATRNPSATQQAFWRLRQRQTLERLSDRNAAR